MPNYVICLFLVNYIGFDTKKSVKQIDKIVHLFDKCLLFFLISMDWYIRLKQR